MKLIAHSANRRIIPLLALILVCAGAGLGQSALPASENNPGERRFNLLVLGDSILWGQGLNEQHKAWYQVKNWLKEATKRDVQENIEAHSGAVVGSSDDPVTDYAKPPDGEVNFARPTINHETDHALKSYADSSQVDLVLLDGCINDVDVRNLLNGGNSDDDINLMAATRCGRPMQALLRKVVASFPSAHVIVTGYFPIISEKTPNDLLMKAMARMFYQPGPQIPKLKTGQLRERLIAISGAWYQASNKTLADAAKKTNDELAAKGSRQRVLFAEIPFPPEYSFSASETRLWGFDASFLRKLLAVFTLGRISIRTNDDRRSQRIASCKEVYKRPANETRDEKAVREVRRMLCRYASLGHPNRKGAAIYVEAITRQLKMLMSQTGWLRDQQPAPRPAIAVP